MNYEKIRINLEQQLGNEIFQAVQGGIILEILKVAKFEDMELDYQKIIDGKHSRVTASVSPRLNEICQEVTNSLEYKGEIDFYIVKQSEKAINTIPGITGERAPIIAMNSDLIEHLDGSELRFVIGYELGKLITRYADIKRVLKFVFPVYDAIPLLLRNKINFWEKLSELSSDRFAWIASPNINKIASCLYKLSSRLDDDKFDVIAEDYWETNEKILENYLQEENPDELTYPVNPLRLKAIELFGKSELYKSLANGAVIDDSRLSREMDELVSNFITLFDTELDRQRLIFIASGGALIARADKKIDASEYEKMLKVLSNYTLFPERVLNIALSNENETIREMFEKSAEMIIQQDPQEKIAMYKYLIALALADNEIMMSEMRELFGIGKRIFGYNETEIAQIIAKEIQENFIHKAY
ncbi:MAG: TerB family tellurite resistance protein [Candidatus Cloacimonetes bacterium]|nr:TerB family tellurite resistance protein [Candidatus Cloacimonadota bacterium]